MEKRYVVLSLIFLLFFSCSGIKSYVTVFLGNTTFSNNEFEKANYYYLHSINEKYQDYVNYNLGNVYFSVGESGEAYVKWKSILDNGNSVNKDLNYRTNFNLGFLSFEQGKYEDAFLFYKEALKIEPKSLAAKKNMEAVINKLNSITEIKNVQQETQAKSLGEISSGAKKILENVKRREDYRWNTEKIEEKSVSEKFW